RKCTGCDAPDRGRVLCGGAILHGTTGKTRNMRKTIVAALAGLAVAAGAALAQVPPGGGMDEDFVLGSEAFLAAHPDLANRTRGMEAYDAGEFGDALDWF